MNEQSLLPGLPGPLDYGKPAGPPETYQRRLTRKRREALARGIHPLTRQPLRDDGETCGSCGNLFIHEHHGRTYFKCWRAGISHGPGTDLRKGWPACAWWREKPDGN